jgi:alpha/beta superfamily hydrolase
VGAIEVAIDDPPTPPRGLALVCHPHPLHGGTLDNKVVQTLARAWVQCGWRSVRFNVRGVGQSEGAWAEGPGEVDDAMAVLDQATADTTAPEPIAVAGFSFGGYVASHVAHRLENTARRAQACVLVAPAVVNFTLAPVTDDTFVVHGEADDVVPLAAILDWARPQALPVVVVPGVGHFFHGQLPLLRRLVVQHLQALPSAAPSSPHDGA